jgi:hypothetical protein
MFDDVIKEIDRGRGGSNVGLDTGLSPINKYLSGVQRKNYYLVGGNTGTGKCLGKGTKIIMFDGSFKNVEDIVVGDKLMGVDSTPRTVTSTTRGREMMYFIRQNKGHTYRVNESHILSFKQSYGKDKGAIINKPLRTVLHFKESYPTFFHKFKGWKTDVDFPTKDLLCDPYLIGLWLGDGSSSKTTIYSADKEVKEYLLSLRGAHVLDKETKNDLQTISLTTRIDHWFNDILKHYNLKNNKHIPNDFLYNNRENRYKLLAGLIDSDGYLDTSNNVCYEITQKNEEFAEQIAYLARSLGFYVSVTRKDSTVDGMPYSCYRVYISGYTTKIPVKIERKKAQQSTRNSNPLVTGIRIEPDKIDDYYGFTLEEGKDKLFLLEDFTVTHNTAFVDQVFVNKPYEYIVDAKRPPDKSKVQEAIRENIADIKLRIFYFSFEIDRTRKLGKWISYWLYQHHGLIISPREIFSKEKKLGDDIYKKIKSARLYFDKMLEHVELRDMKLHPTGVYTTVKNYCNPLGKWVEREEIDPYTKEVHKYKTFIWDDPNYWIIVVVDHIGLLKAEQNKKTGEFATSKKARIDKLSSYAIDLRNDYGCSVVLVSQFNRELGDIQRQRFTELKVQLEDFKDSGNTQEDADIVMALFNPSRYNMGEYRGYNLNNKYVDGKFRAVDVIKNRDGYDDLSFGTRFMGENGSFLYIPPADRLVQGDYKRYFDY